jgi:hypothetical protein
VTGKTLRLSKTPPEEKGLQPLYSIASVEPDKINETNKKTQEDGLGPPSDLPA